MISTNYEKELLLLLLLFSLCQPGFFTDIFTPQKKTKKQKKQNNNYLTGYFFIYFNLVLTLMDSMVFFPPSQSMFKPGVTGQKVNKLREYRYG
jgi:hypothetical protein